MGLIRIRFSPPLVISEQDLQKAIDIILKSLEDFDTVRYFFSLEPSSEVDLYPLFHRLLQFLTTRSRYSVDRPPFH
jgi:hypothetical protein